VFRLVPTQASVRKALAEEEAVLVKSDVTYIIQEDKSLSVMINAGIDLEDQQ
jgi:hypothetical protein